MRLRFQLFKRFFGSPSFFCVITMRKKRQGLYFIYFVYKKTQHHAADARDILNIRVESSIITIFFLYWVYWKSIETWYSYVFGLKTSFLCLFFHFFKRGTYIYVMNKAERFPQSSAPDRALDTHFPPYSFS